MESLDSQLASSQNQESSKPRPKIPQESPAKALRSVAGRRADRIRQTKLQLEGTSFYPVAKGALICLAGEATGGLRSIGVSAGDSFLLPSLSLRRRPCCAGLRTARACSGLREAAGVGARQSFVLSCARVTAHSSSSPGRGLRVRAPGRCYTRLRSSLL